MMNGAVMDKLSVEEACKGLKFEMLKLPEFVCLNKIFFSPPLCVFLFQI